MKKIFVMMAAVAALGFTSCSNDVEEVAESSKELKLNISVADLNMGEQTRAVKTGWADGDKLNIWFDETNYSNPDLVIMYDGSEWKKDASATVSGKEPAASGNLIVFYEGNNDWGKYRHTSSYLYPTDSKSIEINVYALPVAYTENANINYSFESNTLTADINSWKSLTKVQVVLTGLNSDDALKYALKCPSLQVGVPYLAATYTSISNASYGRYTIGVGNEDGVAFNFTSVNSAYNSSPETWEFTLIDTETNIEKTYIASGKVITTGVSTIQGIKIDYSKFE